MAYRIAILPLADATQRGQALNGLESLARQLPGVYDATLDPIGETVRIVYDDERVEVLEIAGQLARQGYPIATPLTTEGEL